MNPLNCQQNEMTKPELPTGITGDASYNYVWVNIAVGGLCLKDRGYLFKQAVNTQSLGCFFMLEF